MDYYTRGSRSIDISSHVGNHYNSIITPPMLDKGSSLPFSVAHPGAHEHLLSLPGTGHVNSPKRLSLDERLEKELGIKVAGYHSITEMSWPI